MLTNFISILYHTKILKKFKSSCTSWICYFGKISLLKESKDSLKYKLLKKINYLGICSKSWFFNIIEDLKCHKFITGKVFDLWCKEVLIQIFQFKQILRIRIMWFFFHILFKHVISI